MQGPSTIEEEDTYDRPDIAKENDVDQHNPRDTDEDVRSQHIFRGSEEEREVEDVDDEVGNEDVERNGDMIVVDLEDESTRRRVRRRAQAMREREGNRRHREGLPRNFLLVDEFTKKPYGVGVGQWRKELMLLSRKLDPSVGNINQHPAGAVAEIEEWIKHTWEYSAPVRFKYVKEVIARGVALRRSDIWKKIRNNEPKPEDVSDRAWRTLGKQLQSLSTVKKMESCSRANASRMNFGRTRPSGEVGVRERLRKWLRRSPYPEEINFEMARNKGYGGRSRPKKESMNVMHGSAPQTQVHSQLKWIETSKDITENEICPEGTGNELGEDGWEGHNLQEGMGGGNSNAAGGGILQLSEEEICKHLLMLKMMQRLEALEGQQRASAMERRVAAFDGSGSSGKRMESLEVEVI